MELNIEVCRAIAVQHGLPLQFVVKEFHLFNVLSGIAAFAGGEGTLVFKGGTALNKVYLKNGQRFSEDLDFDWGGKGELPAFAKELAGGLKDYAVSEFRKVRGTVQFYCTYESPLGGKDHVRVDVAAKRIIVSEPPLALPAVSEITHSTVSGFRVYGLEDLTARKLHALCTRTEGKDVYDAHVSLPMCKRMGKAIAAMLESEGRKQEPGEFITDTIAAVKKADHKKLRNLTNPFIPLDWRPKDWLELKNDLVLKLENLDI